MVLHRDSKHNGGIKEAINAAGTGGTGIQGEKGEVATFMKIIDKQSDTSTDYELSANKFYIFGEKTKKKN